MNSIQQQLNEDLATIIATFDGSDRGFAFLKFRMMLIDMEERALRGDEQSAALLDILTQFSALIQYSKYYKR